MTKGKANLRPEVVLEGMNMNEPERQVRELTEQERLQRCGSELAELLRRYQCELRVAPQLTIVINGQTVVPQIQIAALNIQSRGG